MRTTGRLALTPEGDALFAGSANMPARVRVFVDFLVERFGRG
nr:hypothetical protein [Sphingomonas bacterium]